MRKLISIALLLSIAATSQAQLFRLGLRGGVSSSTVQVEELIKINSGSQYRLESYDPLIGFHAGLFSRITIAKIYLQPEILITSAGGQVKVSDIANGTTNYREQRFTKADIPVLAGYKKKWFRLNAGPVASFTLNEKSNLFGTDGYVEDFKKASLGFQAGIGFDIFKSFALDVKYEGGLSRLGNGLTVGNTSYPYDSRTSQWIVSLGIFF